MNEETYNGQLKLLLNTLKSFLEGKEDPILKAIISALTQLVKASDKILGRDVNSSFFGRAEAVHHDINAGLCLFFLNYAKYEKLCVQFIGIVQSNQAKYAPLIAALNANTTTKTLLDHLLLPSVRIEGYATLISAIDTCTIGLRVTYQFMFDSLRKMRSPRFTLCPVFEAAQLESFQEETDADIADATTGQGMNQ